MTRSQTLLRLFVKGGVIAPADLLRIMDISRLAGNDFIMFGSRQDILFPAGDADKESIQDLLRETTLEYNITDTDKLKAPFQQENIVSSYVAVNMMDSTWWLKEDVYHYVLDSFDYQPILKVNIVDPIQTLVPLFTGHLNFIASREEHYWYLFIRKEEENGAPEPWPELIHGNDIASVARQIEKTLQADPMLSTEELFKTTEPDLKVHSKPIEEKLRMPTAPFPYYEGLNLMQNNFVWLGLYWRNNRFDIDFLSAACRLCQETNVGKISITPWKSFIIKGIRSKDRLQWEKVMGRFGINLRHSSLELNWHLPVMDEEALELKRYLVSELDRQDISTHGLTFTVKNASRMLLFTSVVIEKVPDDAERDQGERNQKAPLYNIRYAREFDPNHSEYILFAENVEKSRLPNLLIQLSKLYFREIESSDREDQNVPESSESGAAVSSYQCRNCMTIYDKKYGDPESGIKPGTRFEELPEEYLCPLCMSEKEQFIPVVEY